MNQVLSVFRVVKAYSIGKHALIVFVLFALWAVGDFNDRFLSQIKQPEKGDNTDVFVDNRDVFISESKKESLWKLFAPYIENTVVEKKQSKKQKKKIKKKWMSEDAQLAQEGVIEQFIIDNKMLKLKAVMNTSSSKERLVLIEVFDNETKKTEVMTYTQNAKVFGYDLSIIKNTQITLSKMLKQDKHEVVLSMYRVKTV